MLTKSLTVACHGGTSTILVFSAIMRRMRMLAWQYFCRQLASIVIHYV